MRTWGTCTSSGTTSWVFFDWQCKSEEFCVHDVTYFLLSSYPADKLKGDEDALLKHYYDELCRRLAPGVEPPSWEVVKLFYVTKAWHCMVWFVFSAISPSFMGPEMAVNGISRICAHIKRHDGVGVLHKVLKGEFAK
mmetsp:Transcript_93402/g.250143  ORF Transcript_93402/g.250143 Transcript_93402/m.250143 type:complete len:137 (-) Transcript_93402:39-449(-)